MTEINESFPIQLGIDDLNQNIKAEHETLTTSNYKSRLEQTIVRPYNRFTVSSSPV